MFLISKNGVKSIDVEIATHGDPTVRVADLEDARREIMSLSGIPPAYLGYADIIELREQLIHTNVSFAAEISDIQEGISNGLSKILDITAEIQGYGYKPSEYIKISLVPPIVLILQLIEMTLSSLGNISGVFQTLNIPTDPYYLLEQYIPHIDWTAFRDAATKYQTINKTKAEMQAARDNADMNASGEAPPPQPAQHQKQPAQPRQ